MRGHSVTTMIATQASPVGPAQLLILVSVLCLANALPADLGTFGTHNDLPTGISSFSLPAEERPAIEPYVLAFINYTYVAADGLESHFAEEKGKYGEGRIFNVRGLLVHVTARYDENDHTACSPHIKGTKGRELPPPGTWVALIKRGNCNFEDKVKHAWMHKALGVIVYNDRDAASLDKMKITERERNITAVFTYKWLGEQMARLVEEGNDLYTSVSEGRYSKNVPNINRTSVLFVSISFIVLMIISLVWLIFYYVQRFRYLQTKDRKSRQLCSVAKRIIAKIPTKNIKADDKQIENDCCAICIEPYKVSDLIRMLPCRHDFHKSCIDPWLLEHRTCPMCKLDILKHYGFVVGVPHNTLNASTSATATTTAAPTPATPVVVVATITDDTPSFHSLNNPPTTTITNNTTTTPHTTSSATAIVLPNHGATGHSTENQHRSHTCSNCSHSRNSSSSSVRLAPDAPGNRCGSISAIGKSSHGREDVAQCPSPAGSAMIPTESRQVTDV